MKDLENSLLFDPIPEPPSEDGDLAYDRQVQDAIDDARAELVTEIVRITRVLKNLVPNQAE